MKKLFDGVATALVTPFKKGEIDWTAFGRLIEKQIEGGVDALVVLGTTGEASTISDTERQAVVNFCIDIVKERVPVIVGTGGNNPKKIVEYGLLAKKAGASGVMITAPYYNKTTQPGIIKFFEYLTKQISHPIIVYNVPGRTGMNILPSTLARLCMLKHIVGIKESSGDIEQIAEVINLCGKTPVYCGDDTLALPCYALGCAGIISVASNARPKETKQLYALIKKRKLREAKALFYDQLGFYKSLFTSVNPVPIKQILSEMKICRNEVRLPLVT